jgi:hypothetical protein
MRFRGPQALKDMDEFPVLRNNLVGFTPQPFRLDIHDAVLRGQT